MYLSLIDPLKVIEGISIAVMAILGIGWGVAKFWKSKDKTDNFIAIHTEIHELLTELRLSAGSMRATVLQFHNGEYFMDGISMRKFSITHESSHRGYISQAVKFKNVLCSLYIPLLNRILEDKAIIYHGQKRWDYDFDEVFKSKGCLIVITTYDMIITENSKKNKKKNM